MTTLLVFTIGAIAGGAVLLLWSHDRVVAMIQEQDARIARLQKDHEALAIHMAWTVPPSRPATMRGTIRATHAVPVIEPDSIACDRGSR